VGALDGDGGLLAGLDQLFLEAKHLTLELKDTLHPREVEAFGRKFLDPP
jgi:hypothetical protein